jgi:hypothetical protein
VGLFSEIERLINEHGSAVILKERIALAEDKYAALERKVKELSDENDRLRSENAELKGQIPAATSSEPVQVDETGEKILLLLAQHPGMELPAIATQLKVAKDFAAFHVDELENAGLVHGSYSMMAAARYSLDQEGRRYLIKKGMLK